jgi:hypothetical protein
MASVVFSTFVVLTTGTHFLVVFDLTMTFFFGTTFYTGFLIIGTFRIFLVPLIFYGAALTIFFFGNFFVTFYDTTGASSSTVPEGHGVDGEVEFYLTGLAIESSGTVPSGQVGSGFGTHFNGFGITF